MPSSSRGSGRRRTSSRLTHLTFDPDPHRLLNQRIEPHEFGSLAVPLPELPFPELPIPELPSHAFRLLRPADLVVLDVLGWDLSLVQDADGPGLVPVGEDARLEVRLPYQHLGELAFYEIDQTTPPTAQEAAGAITPGQGPPPQIQPELGGVEQPTPPPIRARAAERSRLVFAVPGGERIGFDIAGVLAAMSRLPLLVAPLATPRPTRRLPGVIQEGPLVSVVDLPGGLSLARSVDGLILVTTAALGSGGRAGTGRLRPGSIGDLVTSAAALRRARRVLSAETAVNLSPRALVGGTGSLPSIGDLVIHPIVPLPPVTARPRAPEADETAIEAPYRLILSPSVEGGFAHASTPQSAPTDNSRVELWHSRLGVRTEDADGVITVDERAHRQRAVRAIWARDKDGTEPDAPDPPASNIPFRMSLDSRDRIILVRQTADPLITTPRPVDADRLIVSSLGSWLDLHGQWDIQLYAAAPHLRPSILSWDHEAPMGRDQFVRVVYPGYYFCFGHRAALVKVTERKIKDAADPQAYLFQRKFLICSEPVKTYSDRRMPYREVRIRPLVTPDIRDPLVAGTPFVEDTDELFWPVVGSGKFLFTLDCIDWDGRPSQLEAPLLFVAAHRGSGQINPLTDDKKTIADAYLADNKIPANGQSIAYAEASKPGETAMETIILRFTGTPGDPGDLSATPEMVTTDIVIPAMRHLAPPPDATTSDTATPVTMTYLPSYVTNGFAGENAAAQVFLGLDDPTSPPKVEFGGGTDKAGGFIQPDLPIRGLSRVLGAVGDVDSIVSGAPMFDPSAFLSGVLPKLFGLFDLVEIFADVTGVDPLAAAPSFISEALDRIAALFADLEALVLALQSSATRLGEDAVAAATSTLRQQAADAEAAISASLVQVSGLVDDLNDALGPLLNLETSSTPADVAAMIGTTMANLATAVSALVTIVNTAALPAPVKAELERLVVALEPALDAADVIEAITDFVNGIDPEGLSARASYTWSPVLTFFPASAGTDKDQALFYVEPDGLTLSVEARVSATDGAGVDVLAELREFGLNLFPDAPLLRLDFDRLAFRAASGRKAEVDVVFRGIEFVGVLAFIETLKDLIPFDGFADPPYLDISADGVVAGFDVALPNVAVGVFSMENISLGADARVPFLGDAVTVGFYFCTREKPFRLTVMCIGGGGFVGIRLSPKGLVVLEMSLEAGASLSVNLGVASGSVSVMIGIYLRLEAEAGSLTGYFRIRGEVDVLGLISASITLELSLTYEFATGKMVGRASITVEVEVFLFSGSVTISCERRFAGSNGDPTFAQILGVQPDGTSAAWSAYCAAFAGEPA